MDKVRFAAGQIYGYFSPTPVTCNLTTFCSVPEDYILFCKSCFTLQIFWQCI